MKKIKDFLYYIVVQKNAYIRSDYEGYVNEHLDEHQKKRLKSWKLLLYLNWKYRILRKPFIQPQASSPRKQKLPYLDGAESEILRRPRPEIFAKGLLVYDVISFDIFDTLILRPFMIPSDLFMIVGQKLDVLNFKKLRIDAEKEARDRHFLDYGNREIMIHDIYKILERQVGIAAEEGIKAEFETELDLCFANPYMKRVFDLLKSQGKEIVVTSDMYYPKDMMKQLLDKCGYEGISKYLISCDNKCGKSSLGLYNILLDHAKDKKLIHIGDNMRSDITNAAKKNIETRYYKNVNEAGNIYRPDNMSPLIGSAYCGLVNAHLHNGIRTYSPYYEYGYIYAGLYITGFCSFIHQYAKKNNIDKVLFLSRDSDIYRKVFNELYSDIPNEYIYWSRIPAIKTTLTQNRNRFILQCIRQKATDIRLSRIGTLLERLNLEPLCKYLSAYNLKKDEYLIPENSQILENMILDHWDEVLSCYSEETQELCSYITERVVGCKNVVIVDVGWTGSVVLTVRDIIRKNTTTKAYCLLAGIKSTDLSEAAPMVVSRKLIPYIFSSSYNRGLHDWHQNSNRRLNSFLFEMMSQSNSPTFGGIHKGEFIFDIPEVENYQFNSEIHQGVLDFANEYHQMFEKYPYMMNIEGFDAYQPFMLFARDLTFVKKYFSDFAFGRGVISTADDMSMETVRDVLAAHNL